MLRQACLQVQLPFEKCPPMVPTVGAAVASTENGAGDRADEIRVGLVCQCPGVCGGRCGGLGVGGDFSLNALNQLGVVRRGSRSTSNQFKDEPGIGQVSLATFVNGLEFADGEKRALVDLVVVDSPGDGALAVLLQAETVNVTEISDCD